jgi:hypothetical protein
MRCRVIAIALAGILNLADPTIAGAAQGAAKSSDLVHSQGQLVIPVDRPTPRNHHRKERAATVEPLIPDICRGC